MSETNGSPKSEDELQRPLVNRLLRHLIRSMMGRGGETGAREALEELLGEEDSEETSPIDADERILLRNILCLRDLEVADLMIPRVDIVAVDVDTELMDLVRDFSTNAHSRLPVFRESLDDVLGMVHIKDILALWDCEAPFRLSEHIRPVLFVVPSMRALDLLLEMRRTRKHMALVVDEHGGIDGLVTIEDVVEAIVGEIDDEHDVDQEPQIIPQPDGSLIVDARVDLEEFEEAHGRFLTEEERWEDIDTLGGVVFHTCGKVPTRGELVRHPSGLEFEILDADPRRVRRIKVCFPAAPVEDTEPAGDA